MKRLQAFFCEASVVVEHEVFFSLVFEKKRISPFGIVDGFKKKGLVVDEEPDVLNEKMPIIQEIDLERLLIVFISHSPRCDCVLYA
jgi:hypothetical protein